VDRERCEALLAKLSTHVGEGALLWRGADLGGSDVDLVALRGSEGAIAAVLREERFLPTRGDPGHVFWRSEDGNAVAIDVLSWAAWPRYYPSLAGITARARRGEGPLPVSSPEDRLLIFGAEAVAGRPLEKIARRARELLRDPEVRERLDALARTEGLEQLAAIVAEPDRLLRRGRWGRLPYTAALVAASRSHPARAALRRRVSVRSRAGLSRAVPRHRRRRPRGLLVTVSGMDGSGKSTTAEALRAGLEQSGRPVTKVWGRFAGDIEVLDPVASAVKAVLGSRPSIGGPVSAREQERAGPRTADQGRRGPVAWTWVAFIAVVRARRLHRATRPRRHAVAVVCDRWLPDAVVDMELRYGRHRTAELLMSLVAARPDLAILLDIDHATAYERNPEDQARWVLEDMERRYSEAAGRWEMVPIDARQAPDKVVDQAWTLTESIAAARTRER